MPHEKNKEDEILDTLTGLTEAVGSRFDKIDRRFDKVDGELHVVNTRLDEVNGRLDTMNTQLERIEHSILEEHSRRIEALERKVGMVK